MTKYVYAFEEGKKEMRDLLGGKGANLAEMTNIGLPVPRGFTITTEACVKYYDDGKEVSKEIIDEIFSKLSDLEAKTGKKMGDIDAIAFTQSPGLIGSLLVGAQFAKSMALSLNSSVDNATIK